MRLTDEQVERCWIDPWGPMDNGYPQCQAHRRICWAAHGAPPTEAHQVAHSCGVRNCLNPHHLRWATAAENAHDKYEHGTMLRGESSPVTTLTAIEVWAIRRRHAEGGRTQRAIAAEFGICQSTVANIVNRRTWGHI